MKWRDLRANISHCRNEIIKQAEFDIYFFPDVVGAWHPSRVSILGMAGRSIGVLIWDRIWRQIKLGS